MKMNTLELVKSRRSVRTFDGKAPDKETVMDIMQYAHNAANPYSLPITWKVMSAKKNGLSTPVISGTDAFIAGKLQKAPHAEEAFGYSFEDIVLYAQSKGIGTTWIAGTMDRPAFERAMQLEENEVMPCISPLGYPAKKLSLREGMMRKAVKADSRLPFEELFYANTFAESLSEERAGAFANALEIVRWAPSAVNKQPWRIVVAGNDVHFYEKHSRGYVGEDGWDIQKIDMGIALCHFVKGMEEEGRTCEFFISDPGIEVPAGTDYIASFHVTD